MSTEPVQEVPQEVPQEVSQEVSQSQPEPAPAEAPVAAEKKAPQAPVFDHEKKKAELEAKLEKMFNSLGNYMQAELDMTTDDFKMLQELNMAALQKYETMTQNAGDLATYLESIQANYKELKPFLDKIDEIETSIAELEKAVIGLDEYTKRLETRYKKVMKSIK